MLSFNAPNQPKLINLTWDCRTAMLAHCHRKLTGKYYLEGEDHDRKAFGLLGGQINNGTVEVITCHPLLHNARQSDTHKEYMDQMMSLHAIPSDTPFTERGWVASTAELTTALKSFRDLDQLLIGTYHMHRVAWPHDQIRDTPTALDSILGKDSRLFMFIISMVNPIVPIVRSFFEGKTNNEIPIHYI